MAIFTKVTHGEVVSLHCKHEGKHLMVIPETEEDKNGELSFGEEDFYEHFIGERIEEEITENEFLTAAGNITASIHNFIEKIRQS